MILSTNEIKQQIQLGNIVTSHYREELIHNQSIDVRLGRWVYVQTDTDSYWHDFDNDGYLACIKGEFYITHSEEFIGTRAGSNILPTFKLRSSAGRHGIIHTLAGHGDVGFKNRWAMEFIVAKPLILKRFMPIGQIYFTTTTDSGSYTAETGNYQKYDNFIELQAMWDKEDILPKPLAILS
jgi:deoxycytidine triphosphate deaminase